MRVPEPWHCVPDPVGISSPAPAPKPWGSALEAGRACFPPAALRFTLSCSGPASWRGTLARVRLPRVLWPPILGKR